MDTGMGNFAEIHPDLAKALEGSPKAMEEVSIFRTGEVLEIKHSKLRIHNFDGKFLILELLPR